LWHGFPAEQLPKTHRPQINVHLFRRSTSKTWARLMSILLPLTFLTVDIWLHHLKAPLFAIVLLSVAVILITLFCVRLFIAAEDMYIEISSDHVEWVSFMTHPTRAKFSTAQIEELIIYQTRSFEKHAANAALRLNNGQIYLVPVLTGSVVPILKALRQARPDLKETLKIGTTSPHSKAWIRFFLRGKM
jgi:hypothetical protein